MKKQVDSFYHLKTVQDEVPAHSVQCFIRPLAQVQEAEVERFLSLYMPKNLAVSQPEL